MSCMDQSFNANEATALNRIQNLEFPKLDSKVESIRLESESPNSQSLTFLWAEESLQSPLYVLPTESQYRRHSS